MPNVGFSALYFFVVLRDVCMNACIPKSNFHSVYVCALTIHVMCHLTDGVTVVIKNYTLKNLKQTGKEYELRDRKKL